MNETENSRDLNVGRWVGRDELNDEDSERCVGRDEQNGDDE